jgi:hypothetical protein
MRLQGGFARFRFPATSVLPFEKQHQEHQCADDNFHVACGRGEDVWFFNSASNVCENESAANEMAL